MEFPSAHHPLLRLVEDNKNTLKCAHVKYIDVTVEQQFGILRDRIVHMIESGEIVHVNASDQQFTSDTLPSLVNTVTTELTLIKQEWPDSSSSSTIPLNVQCNDAPNGDDANQSVHVGIEVNESKNAQVPIDDVKEEYDYDDDDDDDVDEEEGEHMSDCAGCEDCVKGICGLVGEHDDVDNRGSKKVDTDTGIDEINPSRASLMKSDFTFRTISNVIDDLNQSTGNANLSLIIENEQQIGSIRKATRQQKRENSQSIQPIIQQQSIPSTSGLRSSGRKRIQRKVFGNDDQSKGQRKSDKSKNITQSSKAVKKVKEVNEIEQEEEEKEAKLSIVTLEVNCTEPDCTKTLESIEMWKAHLFSIHDQMPYKHLADNARHNQHGQAEYRCTKCNAVSKSQSLLYTHWKRYHLAGKFQCSVCEFVANFLYKVRNHYQKKHFSSKFQCTQQGCNQTFKFKNNLVNHQRIHTGETPYKCTWDNCQVSFNQIGAAITHVRMKHFRLPRTVKKQKELNIIDTRDPNDYIQLS